ncbi:MAG TPA: DNA repair protein RecO C-terminal domain-containing protein [Treponemataceae bacterium]|nr:DNA repair protein RecO C-terminal domain-containing protein [Treponemataceae bacterium]
MANRSWSTEALVLSLSAFGEGHREAHILTLDRGLIRAAVFGGAKSKLRALVSPFQTGTAWLYTDPVKKSTRITDFDVVAWRPGIREDLVRSWCASFCAEIVTRSHGVADWRLVNAFLDGIAVSGEDECRRGTLRFVWRTLEAAGLCPDLSVCARCGDGLFPEEPFASQAAEPAGTAPINGQKGENEVVYYSPVDDALLCGRCAQAGERRFPLSAESLRYLRAIGSERPDAVRRLKVSPREYAELRGFLFFLVSRMVDGPLKTLEAGDGIL